MTKPSDESSQKAAKAINPISSQRIERVARAVAKATDRNENRWQDYRELADKILEADDSHLAKELKELQQVFDMRWQADMRAIKKWQEQTGKELTWPDHADLCIWLAKENERLRAVISEASVRCIANGDDELRRKLNQALQTSEATDD